MKISTISSLILTSLFLIVDISYTQGVEEYYDRGIKYGIEGKFEEAEAEFKKVLELDHFYSPAEQCLKLTKDIFTQKINKDTAIHLFKGAEYGKEKLWDKAIEEFKRAIAISPNYARSYNNLGGCYGEQGMLDKKISECKKAISLDSDFTEAHYSLGLAYVEKGLVDEAITEWTKAIDIDPNFAEGYYSLGIKYFKKGMVDKALVELKKAITIKPNFADAHNNLAIVYYAKKQFNLAVEHCDKALELGAKVHSGFLEALKPYRK